MGILTFALMLLFQTTPANTPVAEIANAVQVCAETCTITAISSSTAVAQFGVGSTWCPTTITAPKLPLIVSYTTPNLALCGFDPAPNVQKFIVFQQQSTAYTVGYSINGVAQTPKTIPALVSTPPPTTPTVTSTISCTTSNVAVTNYSDGTFQVTGTGSCTVATP